MRIVLLRPPDPDPPPNDFGPPWDLAMAAACLDAAGFEVSGHDWLRLPAEELLPRVDALLDEARPGVVGVFIEYAQRHHAFAVARRVRERAPNVKVVFAGELSAGAPEAILRLSGADAVVLNEGEEAWSELAAAWAEDAEVASVRGLVIATGDGPRRTRPRPLRADLDALPDPAYHLVAGDAPVAGPDDAGAEVASVHCSSLRRAVVVRGSRGCFYRCRFCVESTRDSKVRGLSPERVADQVAALTAASPGSDVVFGDSLFTFDRERAMAVSRALTARRLGVRWSAMTRTDHVDGELLTAMVEAGCVEVAFGVESGSWAVQRGIDKRLSPDTIGPAFAAAREAGVRAVLMLMVGNPGETPATVRETLARVRDLEPDRVLIKTAKLEPGSRLWAKEEAAGWVGEATLADPSPYPPHLRSSFLDDDIAWFREQLRPRTSWIDLAALPVTADARAAISWAAPRARRLVLGGSEPLARRDIPELARFAKAAGAPEVALHTDARALSPERRVAAVLSWGVREILVPWPLDPLAERGVDRFAAAGGAVTLRVGLDRASPPDALAAALARHRPRTVELYYGPSPEGWFATNEADVPPPNDAMVTARKLSAILADRHVTVRVYGLPACVLGTTDPKLWGAPHAPFDERVGGAGEATSLVRAARDQRMRVTACASCEHRDLCDGPHRAHVARFGDAAFGPEPGERPSPSERLHEELSR